MTNIRLLAFPLLLPLISGGNALASDPAKTVEAASTPNLVELKVDTSEGKQASGVTFDFAWGVCSTGAVQLLSVDEVRKFVAKTPDVGDCESARPLSSPAKAEYPVEMIEADQGGSAQVLALIGHNGRVEEAGTVCVSASAFAPLAENVVRTMQFEPARCGAGKLPVKSVILVPVSYDVHYQKTFLR